MEETRQLPRHIAIIMDGNGRWAHEHRLPRTMGHQRGVKVVEKIIKAAANMGIQVLSLYAFSTENWSRPKAEITMLLKMLERFLKSKIQSLMRNNIRLRYMGDISRFPESLRLLLSEAQEATRANTGLILNLALNYGGRDEIVRAAKSAAQEVAAGKLSLDIFDEPTFAQFLYTKDLPDPDLLIRTSGEMRISNFMLWQLSYAELYFCKKMWPDFTEKDLLNAVREFQKRERRFGGIA